jgi:hypothetical protein
MNDSVFCYISVTLPGVLYLFQTWFLALGNNIDRGALLLL